MNTREGNTSYLILSELFCQAGSEFLALVPSFLKRIGNLFFMVTPRPSLHKLYSLI